MLPGFRLLMTSVLLATSVLIFGLGAAALLRVTHEEFATLPALKTLQTPESPFRAAEATPPPVLAMLRVDPPIVASDNDGSDEQQAQDNSPAAQPAPGTDMTVAVDNVTVASPEPQTKVANLTEPTAPASALSPVVVAKPQPVARRSSLRARLRARAHRRLVAIHKRRIALHRYIRPVKPPAPEPSFFSFFGMQDNTNNLNPNNSLYQNSLNPAAPRS
jgi:hypothetical protein